MATYRRQARRPHQQDSTASLAPPGLPVTKEQLPARVFAPQGSPVCASGINLPTTGLSRRCGEGPLCCSNVVRCRVVWRLVRELFTAACARDLPETAARRRPRCHMRQIAMYLSHVVLSVPYQTIATAFDRDRTTVTHACSVVEDRRDDPGYDRFVEQCERCITAVFAPLGHDHAEF